MVVAAVAWAGAATWLVLSAGQAALDARADLRELQGRNPEELLDRSVTDELASVASRLRTSRDRLGSPVLAPVRVLPVIGRQVRSAQSLSGAAGVAATAGAQVLSGVRDNLAVAEGPDTDRVALLRSLGLTAGDASRRLADIDLGPGDALVAPLAEARAELAAELAEVRELVETVELVTSTVAELVEGPGCQLLLAANNAEMRAGSGMFLQAGELCFRDGDIELGPLTETSDLMLPPSAVEITDPDLRDRWGFLLPEAEWRNLGLSPRFDATAALAADMWEQATGRVVDGVIAVDPVALSALLHATGPIEVSGRVHHAGDVVEHLLVGQYEGSLHPDERRDRLAGIAMATVDAINAGGWDVEALVERLPKAAQGRHILAWARDAALQEALQSMSVAGVLAPDSLAVNVLNRGGGRGGGKLDPHLEVRAELDVGEAAGGERDVVVDVRVRNLVEPGTVTYAENPDAPDVRFGVYEGILAVNVPGAAGKLRIDGAEPLALGDDGPTRVVATRFELQPSTDVSFSVRFTLPSELRSLRIEPSGRVPAITWRGPDGQVFQDVLERLLSW